MPFAPYRRRALTVNAPARMRGRGVAQQKVGQAGLWMAGWLTATLGMTVAGRQLAQEV